MLTKEQWSDLARFAGITVEPDGIDVNGLVWQWSPELEKYWSPDYDWDDFGPLWVKLNRWLSNYPKDKRFPTIEVVSAYQRFQLAVYQEGTEADLMQAGCELGAAIGATMRDKGVLAMREQEESK